MSGSKLTKRQENWKSTPLRREQQLFRNRLFRLSGCFVGLRTVGQCLGLTVKDEKTLKCIYNKLEKETRRQFAIAQILYGKRKK